MTPFTNQWLEAALDASLKTFVLAALALLLTNLLRIRDSNVKHRLMSGVLLGMLIMPAASMFLPALRLPIAALNVGANEADASDPFSAAASIDDGRAAWRRPVVSNWELAHRSAAGGESKLLESKDFDANASDVRRLVGPSFEATSVVASASKAESISLSSQLANMFRAGRQWMSFLAPVLLFVWLLGFIVMLMRLGIGMYASAIVVRRARRLEFEDLAAIGLPDWYGALSGGERERISIYESSAICVPGTVGISRIAVLLPEEWIEWDTDKLASVLTHEVTHARRRDPAMMALAGLNRAAYWFHPVAWWLRKQLADLAEAACDDAAIDAHGDRTSYARHLLEVASRVSSGNGRLLAEVVPMARQTSVETRIDAILDDDRPLSRQLSKRSTFILGAAAAVTIAFVATVEPDVYAKSFDGQASKVSSGDTKDSSGAGEAEQPKDESDKTKTQENEEATLSGRIVDPAGRPVEGASLYVQTITQWPPKVNTDIASRRILTTDSGGNFSGEMPESNFKDYPVLDAVTVYKPGFAVRTFKASSSKLPLKIEIELEEESLVSGQILNTEGMPLRSTRISVSVIGRLKKGTSFDGFLSAWKREHNTAVMKTMEVTRAAYGMLDTVTDDKGRFRLGGIPKDALAELRIESDLHATASFYVFNHPGFDAEEFTSGLEKDPFDFGSRIIKSPKFSFVCEPELVIEGLVVDEEERPVEGVAIYGMTGNSSAQQTRTGKDGRYQLTGLRRGQVTHVSFNVSDQDGQLLSDAANLRPDATKSRVELNKVLRRGVTIQGRVTDSLTGEGVSGSIRYVPLPSNEYASQSGFDSFKRSRTGSSIKPDGSYQLVTIPGPGVLLIQASGKLSDDGSRARSYRQPLLSEEEQKKIGVTGNGKDRRFTVADNSIEFLRLQNAAKYVDFDMNSEDNRVDFVLVRGTSVEVRLVDENGEPVNDAFASGLTENWPMTAKMDGSSVTVVNLGEDRPRRVLFLHAERNLAGRVLLKGDETSAVTVTMGPAATIRGRALDPAGQPLAGLPVYTNYFTEHASELYRFHKQDLGKATTDANGRFEITHVMPIGRFNLDARFNEANIRAQAKPEVLERLKLDAKKSVKRLATPSGGVHDLGDLLFGEPFGKKLPWPTMSDSE